MALKDILALITSLAAVAALGLRVWVWTQHITEGIRCQLRSDIMRTYYRHAESKTIRQYEYEALEANYRAYKALRGNSFVDKIHEDCKDWTVTT